MPTARSSNGTKNGTAKRDRAAHHRSCRFPVSPVDPGDDTDHRNVLVPRQPLPDCTQARLGRFGHPPERSEFAAAFTGTLITGVVSHPARLGHLAIQNLAVAPPELSSHSGGPSGKGLTPTSRAGDRASCPAQSAEHRGRTRPLREKPPGRPGKSGAGKPGRCDQGPGARGRLEDVRARMAREGDDARCGSAPAPCANCCPASRAAGASSESNSAGEQAIRSPVPAGEAGGRHRPACRAVAARAP